MSANAINNQNLTNISRDTDITGFVPGVKYTYDPVAKEVDVSDDSAFPSGVSLLRTHVKVHDKFGNQALGEIENPDGSESGDQRTATIDVSGLDATEGLDITATVVADMGGYIADGSAKNITTSGSLGRWDAQKNA